MTKQLELWPRWPRENWETVDYGSVTEWSQDTPRTSYATFIRRGDGRTFVSVYTCVRVDLTRGHASRFVPDRMALEIAKTLKASGVPCFDHNLNPL